jgi:hypothetical protein
MTKLPVIQYLPLTRPRATARLAKQLAGSGVMSILDLEDSAQDPFDIGVTRELKREARNGLLRISKKRDWSASARMYIRINATSTDFFEEDVETVITACQNEMPITGVFLPKVETYAQVESLNSKLSAANGSLEIVPMIETVLGMKNVAEVLEQDQMVGLCPRVHYGHFDYCYDADIWPFPDPCHHDFWDIITPLLDILSIYNKTYIHTPFPFPEDYQLFWSSSDHASNIISSLEVWACTLNAELSFSESPEAPIPLACFDPDMSEDALVNEARTISDDFLGGRARKRSFAISRGRFVPPHQFLTAQRYLKAHGAD